MALNDCGFCDLLRQCGARLNREDFQVVAARLLCDIAETLQTSGSQAVVDAVEALGDQITTLQNDITDIKNDVAALEPLTVVDGASLYSADAVNTSVTSSSYNVLALRQASIECLWANGSSTPAGTFDVEASNDNVNFASLGITGASLSGNSGSGVISLTGLAMKYLRVTYTRTAGTIDLDIILTGKS